MGQEQPPWDYPDSDAICARHPIPICLPDCPQSNTHHHGMNSSLWGEEASPRLHGAMPSVQRVSKYWFCTPQSSADCILGHLHLPPQSLIHGLVRYHDASTPRPLVWPLRKDICNRYCGKRRQAVGAVQPWQAAQEPLYDDQRVHWLHNRGRRAHHGRTGCVNNICPCCRNGAVPIILPNQGG